MAGRRRPGATPHANGRPGRPRERPRKQPPRNRHSREPLQAGLPPAGGQPRPRLPRQRSHGPAPCRRPRRAAPLLREDERERPARPLSPVGGRHRGHRRGPRPRRALHRRRRCARGRVLPQRQRGPEPRGESVRSHRAGARRRGMHHHHGAPLEPHPLAAGVPRGGRAPRVPVPRRGRRNRRGGAGREDRTAHQDRRGRPRVERPRHREPHRGHGRARACARRLHGG